MTRKFESGCYNTCARRTAGILTSVYDEKLAPTGLNVAQFCLLRNLERIGQGNLTEWAEATGVERTTMVRNARTLDAEGWIEELPGRGRIYRLSRHGEETLKAALPLWEAAQTQVKEVLGEEDAEALLRIGKKIQQI